LSERIKAPRQKQWPVWCLVAVITLFGGVLRFVGLDRVGIPGDELEIWHLCTQATSAGQLLSGEVKRSMMSFLPACIEYIQNVFSLEVNSFSLRLPGGLMGTLSIAVVFVVARSLYGTVGGLMASALFALNAVHIQCSREAYPYVVSVAGTVVMLWSMLALGFSLQRRTRPAMLIYPAFLLGLFLMMHSSVAAWPVGLLLAATGMALTTVMLLRPPRRWLPTVLLLAASLAGVLPKLWPYIARRLSAGTMKHGRAGAYSDLALFDTLGLKFAWNFAWGHTPLRAGFTILVLAGLLGLLWFHRKRAIHYLLPGVLLAGFILTMVSRYMSGNPFYTRFLTPVLPVYVILLAGALALPVEHAERIPVAARKLRAALAWTPFGIAVLLLLHPARLSATMTGRPAPYRQIVDWVDGHLPPGTPVMCDRYFDAWNEFKVNAPTGVVFMATIPNEPLERYQQAGWRESAKAFLRDNPDAAFYETKMYWTQIGPWEWPHSHFARNKSFADSSFLELDRLGLNYRTVGDYPKDWLPKTVYYNEPEDLVDRARREGKQAIAIFGRNWTYTKLRDMSDWRVMRGRAVVHLYNVDEQAIEVHLKIVGVAPQQPKAVLLGGRTAAFPANRPVETAVGPLALQPGKNTFFLSDPSWSRTQVPLMVKRLGIGPVRPE